MGRAITRKYVADINSSIPMRAKKRPVALAEDALKHLAEPSPLQGCLIIKC